MSWMPWVERLALRIAESGDFRALLALEPEGADDVLRAIEELLTERLSREDA